jgi:serine protease
VAAWVCSVAISRENALHRRLLNLVFIMVLVLCTTLFKPAQAIQVDPALQAIMSSKNSAEPLPVLLIFDQSNRLDSDFLTTLDSMMPEARRKAALARLRWQATDKQSGVTAFLNEALQNRDKSGAFLENVKHLYLANAITFSASAELVTKLATRPEFATLFYDKTYDMATATEMGVRAAPAPKSVAAVDTVWSTKYIRADKVWRELGFTGTGIVVALIDSGVWLSHPDLENRLWINAREIPNNNLDDDGNGFVDDIHGWDFGDNDQDPNDDSASPGHGTHTGGTVVGDGSGGTSTGTAPGAQLMPLKVWRADGTGATMGAIWASHQYAVENGARVISMSIGFPGPMPMVFRQTERNNTTNIRDAGVTIIASSGNDRGVYAPPNELSLTARVPAPWRRPGVLPSSTGGVISVGATAFISDEIWGSSSRGPATWGDVEPWSDWPLEPGPGLIKPDIAAPGLRVNSTVVGGGYSGNSWSGTSMACPHVAGVAALMLEKNPTLSPAGVDSLMELNAIDLGDPGKDVVFGAGRLDAFAIVSAVPLSEFPDLVWSTFLPDPDGDLVLDQGEESVVQFVLRNVSQFVSANEVLATMTIVENPYVSVVDGTSIYQNLGPGQYGTNEGDVFRIAVAADAPHGYEFKMLVSLAVDGMLLNTFDVDWEVGLPEWRTLNRGGIYLTVTDQGMLGYMAQDQFDGVGLGYQSGESDLFVGSFWAGTDLSYICNRDYDGLGSENFEWMVSAADPLGRVRDLGELGVRQSYRSFFTDQGHASPRQLLVEQNATTYAAPENDQFVILEYILANKGPDDLVNLYNGVFCDFDLGNSNANLGGTDVGRNLAYIYEEGGRYVGVAKLGEPNTSQNLTLINNPIYVFPTSSISDGIKMKHLRGLVSSPAATTPDDWSALASSVMDLPAYVGRDTVAYALVVGSGLAEIEAAVDAANTLYLQQIEPDTDTPPLAYRLEQNRPNPFNPITEITYVVPVDGHVELTVYDLAGRRVKELVAESMSAGKNVATWDGRDDSGLQVPSGLYFYKYVTSGKTVSRKMTLLK